MARKKNTRSGIEWKELLNEEGEFFKGIVQEVVQGYFQVKLFDDIVGIVFRR